MPFEKVGAKFDENEASIAGEDSLAKVEDQAGPLGVGVQGPGTGGEVHVGTKGLKMGDGAKVASDKVQVALSSLGRELLLSAKTDLSKLAFGPFNFKMSIKMQGKSPKSF